MNDIVFSAAVLIWQGCISVQRFGNFRTNKSFRSVRTKRFSKIEEELRAALGVPPAIGGIPPKRTGAIDLSKNNPIAPNAMSPAPNPGSVAEPKHASKEGEPEKTQSPVLPTSTPEPSRDPRTDLDRRRGDPNTMGEATADVSSERC